MNQEVEIPDYFHEAVRSMDNAPVRSAISVGHIRPPRNLAPLSHAIGLEVLHPDLEGAPASVLAEQSTPAGDAYGRLILLHDPQSDDHYGISAAEAHRMRMVAYITADMDDSLANDPLMPEVAWQWLTECLEDPEVEYTQLGGTVTSTASVRYGEIGGPPRSYQLELRASWTAHGTHIAPHVTAFSEVLCSVAGLPPEGVSLLPNAAP